MEEYLKREVIEGSKEEESKVYFCGFECVVGRWFMLYFYYYFFEDVDCECLFLLFL